MFVTDHLLHYNLPSLTFLKFENNSLSHFGLKALFTHTNLKQLEILSVANNKITKIDDMFEDV